MSNDILGFKFRPYQRWQPGPWPPKTRVRRRGGAEERRGPMMCSHPTCRGSIPPVFNTGGAK